MIYSLYELNLYDLWNEMRVMLTKKNYPFITTLILNNNMS